MSTDRFLLASARDAVDAVRRAFGAPGDHGYGTPQGDALFELYKQRAALQDAIEASAVLAETRQAQHAALQDALSPMGKGVAERAHRRLNGGAA